MRRLAGTSLIVAPVLVVASEVLAPTLTEEGSRSLAVLESHLTDFRLWVWGGLAAAAFLVPAVCGLQHLARGRRLTSVGTALAAVGVLGYAAHQALFLSLPTLLEGDRAEMAALYERQGQTAESGILIFLVFLIPLFLGLTLLGISAYRSGATPLWPGIVLALAFVPGFLPVPFDAGLVSFALLLLGLGAYGVLVLRMSDETWLELGRPERAPANPVSAVA
jgi:hypothetical protein